MEYDHALRLLKSTFIGGKDCAALSATIASEVCGPRLRLLDIGVGDGSYASKLKRRLRAAGRAVDVVGLDPYSSECNADVQFHPVPLATFLNSQTASRFDVVLARHSLYYIAAWQDALRDMVRATRDGGLCVVALWSANCGLRQLSAELGASPFTPTGEDVVDWLTASRFQVRAVTKISGSVDIDRWRSDVAYAEAAARVISRSSPDCRGSLRAPLERLLPHRDTLERVNVVVCFGPANTSRRSSPGSPL
jgi:SAM-dependent methyltransferase